MRVTSTTQTQYTQATNRTTATKATSAYESTTPTQTTDKMAAMKEKYKDVYTPIPETYSKADEELQTRKIYESYPDYISGPEFLKIVNSYYDELGGEKMELGLTSTQEQKDKQEMAFQKAYDLFGGEESFIKMQQGVKEIQNDYPVNNWAKENIPHAKEITRFTNAVVYEGLEDGKTVEEAKKNAITLADSFIAPNFFADDFFKRKGVTGMRKDKPDTVTFASSNPVWDLRKYGIEGEWEKHKVYENKDAMISELEKKIGQFNFMLNNKSLMESANNKLDAGIRGQIKTYESRISDRYLPNAQTALDVFKNYKIYDSIDVKA